jgi:hypothetical protein
VPVAQADELAAALGDRGAPVTVRRFADTDHLFLADSVGDPGLYLTLPSRDLRPAVVDTVVAWLRRRLSDGGGR